MDRRFLLLCLPYLAFEESIKLMQIENQFALSNISKRSQRVVKCVLRNRKYDADLYFHENSFRTDMIAFEVRDSLILVAQDEAINADTIKESITRLTNTFTVKYISMEFREKPRRLISVIIPFLKQLGLPYGISTTDDWKGKNDKICEFILKKCGNAETLNLKIPTTPKFSPNPDDFGPFQCRLLKLDYPSWITLDHIIRLFINCNQILIFDCKFTPTEINRLLKTWQKGSKIEHFAFLYLTVLDFPLEAVLNGISATPAETVSVEQECGWIPCHRSGFIIEQENGQQAFVYLEDDDNVYMSSKFELDKEDK